VELRVLSRHELPVRRESDIVEVRRKARACAQYRGFDAFATTALTTATSELTRNAFIHGGGGDAILEELTDGVRFGVRVTLRDAGPGIAPADLERVLKGGFSTARSLGLGVSGTRRLVDAFEIDTAPGRGTTIVITKWTRF
jgi:serine/threonine-protein kinase RsbT